ncbi:MAG: ABC transporter ATP-binding protein, partial [Acidobacteriaceae bacterium]
MSTVGSSNKAITRSQRVLIRTLRLCKTYRIKTVETVALAGIDITIMAGEFLAVMGPSGSGKSTFFNMIGGLDSPSSGRVLIDEVDVGQLTAVELAFLRCRKVGYIFQTFNLIPYLTALENVTAPLAFAGTSPDEACARGMEVLKLVGLGDRWSHRPLEMSGGQQQRVAIARAMANRPSVLLCDEPTANLDLKTGEEILEILKGMNRDHGVTIICATHDHRMLSLCDRLVWIRDGRVERIALREELTIESGQMGG